LKTRPTAKKRKARGIWVPIKHGKFHWAALKKPSDEAKRKQDAEDLVAAIIDAAHKIGIKGVVGDYSRYDFYLYPRHIADFLNPSHPFHSAWASKDKKDETRVVVPWPARQELEEKSLNEYREKPAEIIGLLMRRMLDGDAAFFEEVAAALREGKRQARCAEKRKRSIADSKGHIRACAVQANCLEFGLKGDSDWFARISKPARKSKAPYAIWKLCEKCHSRDGQTPTRLQIRDELKRLGIRCANLSTALKRLNLQFLQEGGRPRKT
jgi:hypothetical protein